MTIEQIVERRAEIIEKDYLMTQKSQEERLGYLKGVKEHPDFFKSFTPGMTDRQILDQLAVRRYLKSKKLETL